MLGSLTLLADTPQLRPLLDRYGELRRADAGPNWHDRVRTDALPADELHRLYGLLIAHGWLDAQVGPECHAVAGEVRSAYRITREGLHALSRTDAHFGVVTLDGDDES